MRKLSTTKAVHAFGAKVRFSKIKRLVTVSVAGVGRQAGPSSKQLPQDQMNAAAKRDQWSVEKTNRMRANLSGQAGGEPKPGRTSAASPTHPPVGRSGRLPSSPSYHPPGRRSNLPPVATPVTGG